MKSKKIFKGALAVLTSLALVLSTSTTAWAAPNSDTMTVGGMQVIVSSSIYGTGYNAATRAHSYTPSLTAQVSSVLVIYANDATNETYFISPSPATGSSEAEVWGYVPSNHSIKSVSASHDAWYNGDHKHKLTSNP